MKGADRFDAIMASLDSPVAVVTTASEEVRAGCLVGFHTQSGITPKSLAVWLSKANHTFRVAVFAEHFAVHFLSREDMALAELFGTTSGDDVDKFARCDWTPGIGGVPVLDGCPNRAIGRKVALLDTRDDHVCLVLEPLEAVGGTFDPLRLSQVAHLGAGHEAEERHEPADTRSRD